MHQDVLLALDTSSSACSVALWVGPRCWSRFELTLRAHSQLILPMIESLMQEAGVPLAALTAIAVGRGPGSFTGVRIAISAAQGLAFALQIPVYPISTLEALAWQAAWPLQATQDTPIFLSAIDARMQEVYMAGYHVTPQGCVAVYPEQLEKPQYLLSLATALCAQPPGVIGIGSAWDAYFLDEGTVRVLPQCFPDAKDIGALAMQRRQKGDQGIAARALLPVYLRDNVAVVPTSKETKIPS